MDTAPTITTSTFDIGAGAAAPPPAAVEPEAAPSEPKPPEPPAPPKERDGARFAALAAKEREARNILRRAEQEGQRVARDKAELAELREIKRLMSEDPLGALRKHGGIDYETLTKKYILGEKVEEKPAREPDPDVEELKAWRKAQEEQRRDAETKAAQERNARIVQDHLNEQHAYATAHADDFEMVLSDPQGASSTYLDLYRQTYNLVGRDLNQEEQVACLKRTEELLTEAEVTRLERLAKTKKLASRFAAPKPEPSTENREAPKLLPAQADKPRSLSNDLTSQPRPVQSKAAKSSEERHRARMAEIAAKYDGK